MGIEKKFWQGKRVFITGHTGFKGTWLCLCLQMLGAEVSGYALEPPTHPNLFELCGASRLVLSNHGDVRDYRSMSMCLNSFRPEIVIHMAAQPLVRESYINPAETYEVNVMGTVNLLEAIRQYKNVRAVINVTTDKCYENREWCWSYRENDPLGGYDPYSNSKACSELVTGAYRNSFFKRPEGKSMEKEGSGETALASARAGNAIGGGDWAKDRLIPDCMRALLKGEKIKIRNPCSIRPWQHVLEPLAGYLLLAQKLYEHGAAYAQGWNFGPDDRDAKPVAYVVNRICEAWSGIDFDSPGVQSSGKTATLKSCEAFPHGLYETASGTGCENPEDKNPHEALYLKLDCAKAKSRLGWQPVWTLDQALHNVVEWYAAYRDGKDVRDVCMSQIGSYFGI